MGKMPISEERPGNARRSRWRLTVGTLMLLIVGVALWLGWVTNKARKQLAAVEAVKKYGGWAHYDYEFVNGKVVPGREPSAPKWLRRAVGDEYFRDVAEVSLVYDDSSGKRYENASRTPGLLPYLESQNGLKRLLLRGTQATDEGLTHIRGLSNLEDLYIWDSNEITDDGVAQLQNLTKLQNLHLDHSKMTDRGFEALNGLTNLRHLVLEAHSFSDRGIAAVDGMRSLTWLCVGGEKQIPSNITDVGLKHVEHLVDLENLDLSYAKVTDTGLDSIKGLKKLKHLSLPGCNITDEGLAKLSGLSNLEWLILNDTQITDEGLKIVDGLPKLKLIAVHGTRVTDDGRAKLKQTKPTLKVF